MSDALRAQVRAWVEDAMAIGWCTDRTVSSRETREVEAEQAALEASIVEAIEQMLRERP